MPMPVARPALVAVSYTHLDVYKRQALHELARQYGLIVTGGTDFHGMHMSKPTPLGAVTTADGMLARIEALAQSRSGAPRRDGA